MTAHAAACMRTLHTLKGGARLAGAMRLGEMAHRLETRIERLTAADAPAVEADDVEALQGRVRRDGARLRGAAQPRRAGLCRRGRGGDRAVAPAPRRPRAAPSPTPAPTPLADAAGRVAATPTRCRRAAEAGAPPPAEAATRPRRADAGAASRSRRRGRRGARRAAPAPSAVEPPAIDWSRFAAQASARRPSRPSGTLATQSAVRVRAPLLDRLVNQAGEVSITRSRIEVGRRPDQGLARPT